MLARGEAMGLEGDPYEYNNGDHNGSSGGATVGSGDAVVGDLGADGPWAALSSDQRSCQVEKKMVLA
jgi:hypothetical protein